MAGRLGFERAVACLAVIAGAGCRSPSGDPRAAASRTVPEPPPPASSQPAAWHSEYHACNERLAEVSRLEPVAGVPEFEARRAQILGRAKGSPVLLLAEPRPTAAPSAPARALLEELELAPAKATALFRRYPDIVRSKELAREVLLRDGYLFAKEPSLAFGLGHVVKLEDLFDAPRLWLQRGADTLELSRVVREGRARYVEGSGAQERRGTLLFLDRVASDQDALDEPLHRDLGAVFEQLAFESARVEHLTETHAVLAAQYEELSVPTLLRARGVALELECEAVHPDVRPRLERVRSERRQRAALVERLRQAIAWQVDESLPFDEPRTEFGQEDGKLRETWQSAYFRGSARYDYNDDGYPVFDAQGRPHVPQVCIDFIADTFDRAAGTWYAPRGAPPERRVGGLDFSAVALGAHRRVQDFVDFAERTPAWFEVWRPEERVPLRKRRAFFDFIERHKRALQPGDVVVIYGLRDDEEPHYHSFFVYQTDPITGAPITLASNAVRPQIRSWEGEMHNAPRRSIRARIRPRSAWLAEWVGGDTRGTPLSGSELAVE